MLSNKSESKPSVRMFNDTANLNQRLYRESEAFVKLNKDKAHLRSDNPDETKILYEPALNPFTECHNHQQNSYKANQNIIQRRFPMLREYEKAKDQLAESMDEYTPKVRGFTSERKKMKSIDEIARLTQPTFNQQVKQKRLLRANNGLPLSKVRQPTQFIPNNPFQAKKSVESKNFGLYWDDYESKRKQDFDSHLQNKQKMVAGVFRHSYYNDNNGKKSQTRLRTSGDQYLLTSHNFTTFLNEKEDLPRLSILQNYQQIMRVMNNTYIKSVEFEKKYRGQKDVQGDDEYVKFKEEEVNTKKMSTILKKLNSPRRRTQQNFNKSTHSMNRTNPKDMWKTQEIQSFQQY